MVETDEQRRFRVRCRSCGRTVFSNVRRIGDREAQELKVHLKLCRTDLSVDHLAADVGVLFGHFEVLPA